jgi:hypothetical protein
MWRMDGWMLIVLSLQLFWINEIFYNKGLDRGEASLWKIVLNTTTDRDLKSHLYCYHTWNFTMCFRPPWDTRDLLVRVFPKS